MLNKLRSLSSQAKAHLSTSRTNTTNNTNTHNKQSLSQNLKHSTRVLSTFTVLALFVLSLGVGLLPAKPVSAEGGYTWTEQTGSGEHYWSSIASSADGNKLAAVDAYGSGFTGGSIYTSTDSGVTWTEQTAAGSRRWASIASSADGSKLAASIYNGYIYTSTDSGATWTEQTDAGSRDWFSITSSADGSKLAASIYNGYIYTSTDSGATWTEQTAAGSRKWAGVSSSDDGSKLIAIAGLESVGHLYTSTDSGVTWTEQTDAGSRYWRGVTTNADGSKVAAVVLAKELDPAPLPGLIYTAAFAPPPTQTTFPNAENAQPITLTTPASTTLTCNTAVTESSLADQDPTKQYPLGLVDFCLEATQGSTQEISLTFTTNLTPSEVVARKYNPNTKQYADVPGATITETTVGGSHALVLTYNITDGGELDTDGTANGTILDPVGLAVDNDSTALTGSNNSNSSATLANTGTSTNAILTTATLLTLTGVLALATRKFTLKSLK